MVAYLAQKYFINTLVFVLGLVILPLLFWGDTIYLIPKALFWGGLFGGIYTFFEFRKKHIWPLYDNLGYSKYLLFLILFITLQILSFVISSFI
ncbi:MAG TPA: hypothetical protein VKA34_20585 [Balneolales bacterium]|nr:hypothetical protein [Balneolales bacterium]